MRRTLSLHRETLTPLTPDDLADVAAGAIPTLNCTRIDCPTAGCPSLDYCYTLPIRTCIRPE